MAREQNPAYVPTLSLLLFDPITILKDPRRQKQLEQLLHRLGLVEVSEVDFELLELALTHPSISRQANYQQLEFVGDAVIRLVAAEILLETYPQSAVGDFGAVRSILVSDQTLAEFAESYGIEKYLLIAPTTASNQAAKVSVLADTFEAILGALYLSTHNMKLVRSWLDPIFQTKAKEVFACPARQNYKDALQEWTQSHHKTLPVYQVQENLFNPELDRFTAEVWLKDQQLGSGTGRTKKAAEQAAAKAAFFSVVHQP